MASAVLGKVSPTPKGEYVSTQDYDRLDVVTYEGYPYLAKSNVPSGNLPTDELYWMPLLTGLDFAPGGYGLGMTAKEILDANAAVDNGWYKLTSVNVANAHIPFQYVAIYVTAYSDKYVTQDLYRTNGQNAHMRRELYNGTWGEWEYVNPPLMANVEYRTTERVDGKAVYKKRDSNGKILYRLDGSNTWIDGLPGAAPAGIVSKYTIVADESALNNALTETINAMANDTAKFLAFYPTSSALFGGKGEFCELYRRDASYAVARFTSYGTTSPDILYKTLWNGTWTSFTDGSPSAFAPSGYGYGGSVPYVSVSDMWTDSAYNTALDGLLSGMKDGEAKQIRIPYIDGTTTLGTVYRSTNDYATVVCYGYGSYGIIARKTKYNGYWYPWEWENPPMNVGTEYKTTERYQGNPVYVKLIDAGTLPNNSTKYVEGAIENGITKVVDVRLNMYSVSGMAQRTNDNRIIVTANVESPYAWFAISASEDFSTYSGQIVAKYIK